MDRIKVQELDLDLTFYPAFTSALFVKRGAWYVKDYGHKKGAKFRIKGDFVEFEGASEVEIKAWTGLWYDPLDYLAHLNLKENIKNKVENIVSIYRKLRISISPWDEKYIFVLTFLSRNTDYHTNVVKWWKRLKDIVENEKMINREIKRVGRSYQLKQLGRALSDYMKLSKRLDGWSLRKDLLSIKYVGPKVVDAYLLFSGKGPIFTPSDVHFSRFVRRLGLLEFKTKPNKSLCLEFTCYNCPMRNSCLTGLSVETFKELSGWLQTVSYYHDKVFCARSKCNICSLKSICSGIEYERN